MAGAIARGDEAHPPAVAAAPQRRFVVALDGQAANAPSYKGRLFVFLSTKQTGEPRRGPSWFKPEPFFARDVTNARPGEQMVIDDAADGFPARLSQIPPGKYRAQAVLDHSLDEHNPGTAAGNFYSEVIELEIEAGKAFNAPLALTKAIEPRPWQGTKWLREVKLVSRRLSDFHHREVTERAAVVLPKSYFDEPDRRYPVIYSIPGFGGDHHEAATFKNGAPAPGEGETEFIRVFLSGECRYGHHVFANSATNGPRGDAFIYEMIPHIDQQFRTVAKPFARYVTGHSSGGWAALWLMANYPQELGGAWATSPDPVDFRDFQQIDLYSRPPPSMFVDAAGDRRPIGRRGREPSLWFDDFSKMDDVLARGGQLRSFEAVFSPAGGNGEPLRLWNRQTGEVDPAIAEAWSAYDIRKKLESNWQQLGPLLAGKLHVWIGSLDTFYLEGAVRLLKQSLAGLGSDAEIVIVPERNHATLLTSELRSTIRRQMSEQFLKSQARQEQLAPVGDR